MKSIEKMLEKTLMCYEKRDYSSAEQIVNEILESNPDFHRGWFIKGVILEETDRINEANKCFDKAGNLFNMFFRLAVQLQHVDSQRALQYYDRVLQMDQKSNLAWLNKGLILENMGRVGDAQSCYRNLSPWRELISRIVVPAGFMIFLIAGGTEMIRRGEKALSIIVMASAVFCFFWIKRDAGTAIKMFLKKRKYRNSV